MFIAIRIPGIGYIPSHDRPLAVGSKKQLSAATDSSGESTILTAIEPRKGRMLPGVPVLNRNFFAVRIDNLHSDFQCFRSDGVGFYCLFSRIRIVMLAQKIVQLLFCSLSGTSIALLDPSLKGLPVTRTGSQRNGSAGSGLSEPSKPSFAYDGQFLRAGLRVSFGLDLSSLPFLDRPDVDN